MIKPTVKNGDLASSISANDWNARAEQIERQANLGVGGGLMLSDGPNGKVLAMNTRPGFWAKVSGTINPYKFQEVSPQADGTFITTVGGFRGDETAGSFRAYEVNDEKNLDGKVFWLEPGTATDFRFVAICGCGNTDSRCAFGVHLQRYADGSPISGATVTATPVGLPSGRPTISGTTDNNGNFTFPIQGSPDNPTFDGNYVYSISYGNLVQENIPYPRPVPFCAPRNFCYCKIDLTITTPSGANASITDYKGDYPGAYYPPSGLDPFTVISDSGGILKLRFERLMTCLEAMDYGIRPYFPGTYKVVANGYQDPDVVQPQPVMNSGYLSSCAEFSIACDDDKSVDLPMFHYGDCYWVNVNGEFCLYPNDCHYNGPEKRGLLPRSVQVRFNGGNFGDDDGQWITLNGMPIYNHFGAVINYFYDSGCRGAMNNKINCGSSYYAPNYVLYGSTRVTWTFTHNLPGATVLGYARHGNTDCTTTPSCDGRGFQGRCIGFLNRDGSICRADITVTGFDLLCTPINQTISGDGFTVDIREVPCG